jgi:hypothetical protein
VRNHGVEKERRDSVELWKGLVKNRNTCLSLCVCVFGVRVWVVGRRNYFISLMSFYANALLLLSIEYLLEDHNLSTSLFEFFGFNRLILDTNN